MKRLVLLAITLLLTSNIFADDHTQYVNPFIGTQTDATGALSGSTFPGACVPFGLPRDRILRDLGSVLGLRL